MAYDIVIKNGMVIDGSGGARYRGDLAIQDGIIAAMGRINERARRTIDLLTVTLTWMRSCFGIRLVLVLAITE